MEGRRLIEPGGVFQSVTSSRFRTMLYPRKQSEASRRKAIHNGGHYPISASPHLNMFGSEQLPIVSVLPEERRRRRHQPRDHFRKSSLEVMRERKADASLNIDLPEVHIHLEYAHLAGRTFQSSQLSLGDRAPLGSKIFKTQTEIYQNSG